MMLMTDLTRMYFCSFFAAWLAARTRLAPSA